MKLNIKTLCSAGALLLCSESVLAMEANVLADNNKKNQGGGEVALLRDDNSKELFSFKTDCLGRTKLDIRDLEDITSEQAFSLKNVKIEGSLEGERHFEILSEFFKKATNVEMLEITGFTLREIPDTISGLKSLENLNINFNSIESIPSGIENLKNLRRLSLSDNRLTEIPEEIGNMENLEELYLERNQIKKIPETIGNLKKLRRLRLSNNMLIPYLEDKKYELDENGQLIPFRTKKWELVSLEEATFFPHKGGVFHVDHNGWTFIPSEQANNPEFMKGYVQNLDRRPKINLFTTHKFDDPERENMDLVMRKYLFANILTKTIPDSLYNLTNLRDLSLGIGLSVSAFMKPIWAYGEIHWNWTGTKDLDLSGKNLSQVPLDIFEVENLEKLNLSNNQLKKIPASLKNLERLKEINLSGNPEFDSFDNISDELLERDSLEFTLSVGNEQVSKTAKEIREERAHRIEAELKALQMRLNKLKGFGGVE